MLCGSPLNGGWPHTASSVHERYMKTLYDSLGEKRYGVVLPRQTRTLFVPCFVQCRAVSAFERLSTDALHSCKETSIARRK